MKLEVQSLSAGYGCKLVLDGVELTVPDGRIVTLVGANGCGKSTLLKAIGRLLKPKSGAVLLDGKSIRDCDTAELARRMAILPQLHHAAGEITVQELVGFGRFPHRTGLGGLNAHDREMIGEALRLTRLEAFRERRVGTLSGGERQRAWIAMTLAQEPKLLLLDEPTTFLDIRCQFDVIELVRDLNRRLGITVLMVLHDLNLAARCSDLLVTLKERRIRNVGTPAEILNPEILRDIFEIESEIHTGSDGIPYCLPTGSVKKEKTV
ncbi:putative siderophore transport system ATP-binding protein YusV [bioreactor metagenome]|uniref:Putative siderophore transport system ATP-binding protein YusV n=1 Tax=bioreactor metagenome TaxID=1076179 RepID=A0A645EWJ2_9ZZZZ